jgi:hypothetical protein
MTDFLPTIRKKKLCISSEKKFNQLLGHYTYPNSIVFLARILLCLYLSWRILAFFLEDFCEDYSFAYVEIFEFP